LRWGACGPKIVAMTTNRPLTLRLEPHADRQLIAGWVVDERGYEHYFSTWLGLLTLLEHARLVAAEGAPHGAGQAGTGRREARNE
jgi:hypothetical protein